MTLTTIYRQAPDLLLDTMAEVNSVLSKQDKKTESYKFWKRVSDVMKFSWGYMNDFHYVIKENELLKAENAFLKSMAGDYTERLKFYETVKAEKLAGTFEDTISRVDKYLANGD
jgi:hypothetical protein